MKHEATLNLDNQPGQDDVHLGLSTYLKRQPPTVFTMRATESEIGNQASHKEPRVLEFLPGPSPSAYFNGLGCRASITLLRSTAYSSHHTSLPQTPRPEADRNPRRSIGAGSRRRNGVAWNHAGEVPCCMAEESKWKLHKPPLHHVQGAGSWPF